jgi:hypothetical protein
MFPFEMELDDDGSYFIIRTETELQSFVLHFFEILSTLETIAAFSPGKSGDMACQTLVDIGVWADGIQNLDTGKIYARQTDTADPVRTQSRRDDGSRGPNGTSADASSSVAAGGAGRPRPRRSESDSV